MHHTKEKGDLGVLKAQVKFAEKGYKILEPKSEHLSFDFVVYCRWTLFHSRSR